MASTGRHFARPPVRRPSRGKPVLAVPLVALMAATATSGAGAFWTTEAVPGSNGAAAASVVESGATPTAAVVGHDVALTWVESTLSTGHAVDGYIITRYDAITGAAQSILSNCDGTVVATTCTEYGAPDGTWTYTVTPVFATSWRGAESIESSDVTLTSGSTTAPTNAVTVTDSGGAAAVSGDIVHYRGVAGGSFTLTNALTAVDSDPESSTTSPLSGTSTGWAHTASTVSTPTGGPYVSNPFEWSAGTTSSPSVDVTGRDAAGTTDTNTLSYVNDSTAPSAGSVSYPDGEQTTTVVSVSFTSGSDTGSGVGTRLLQRSDAPLTSGTCGTYGAFATVTDGTEPTSPHTDAVAVGACYRYRYVVTDRVGNQHIAGSSNVVKVRPLRYSETVLATGGLLNYYRLGETASSSDTFTGAAGALLTSRAGEIGATWAYHAGSGDTEQISSGNRARRNGTGYSINYTTTTPAFADYYVEADLFVMSNIPGDRVGVIGRLDTATNSYYMARWELDDTSWNLVRVTDGSPANIGKSVTTGKKALSAGAAYRLRLTMTGTKLTLHVNGSLTVSATDSSITAAGKAGIMDGEVGGTASKDDTSGIHIDNFEVMSTRVADSKGTNTGDYFNGVTLGGAGALTDDADASARFDGSDDHAIVARQISTDFTIEFWFSSTQSFGSTCAHWWQGARLVDAEMSGGNNDFGTSLCAGRVIVGVGGSADVSIVSAAAYNDGAWHHVVFTRTQSTGEFQLFIDGASVGSAITHTNPLTASTIISFGRSPGGSNPYAGSLDEVALYTSVLSSSTVAAHFARR